VLFENNVIARVVGLVPRITTLNNKFETFPLSLSHTLINEYTTQLLFTLSGKFYKYSLESRMCVDTQSAYTREIEMKTLKVQ
jgi:hypothetical protein